MKCLKPFRINGGLISHPCGGCAGCRLNRSREWAVRCVHQASLSETKQNCFITLTYSDEHLPKDLSLKKEYFQDFMKRFRKNIQKQKETKNRKIKYFACGEYGGAFGRPHYHFICFNYDPRYYSDYDYEGRLKNNKKDVLSESWNKGFVNVKDFNFERSQYVAKYIMKKLGGERAIEYENIGIEPEFGLMSRGLGFDHLEKNKELYNEIDEIFCNGKTVTVPKAYRRKLQETFGENQRRKVKTTEIRLREAEEIVKCASSKGHYRSPKRYYDEIINQRKKDFESKQRRELENVK